MVKKKPLNIDVRQDAEVLMQSLFRRMELEKTAEELNNNVIIPFTAAIEEVCTARGYVLNIFGEKSNFVFTGSEKDAEEIYNLIEKYLAAKA
jgi:hypothetical protein